MGVSSSFEVPWKWKHGLKLPGTQPCRTSENHPSEVEADRKTLGSRASQPFLYCESHHVPRVPEGPCGSHGDTGKQSQYLFDGRATLEEVSKPGAARSALWRQLVAGQHTLFWELSAFFFSLPLVTSCIMQSQTFVQRSFSLPGSVSGMGSSLLHLVWKRAILTPSLPKMHIVLVTNTCMTPDPQDKQHLIHSFPRLKWLLKETHSWKYVKIWKKNQKPNKSLYDLFKDTWWWSVALPLHR